MAQTDFLKTFISDESFVRGAARLLWAGTTVVFPTSISAVVDPTTYNAQTGWNDLGATKTGIQISINNSEENFDVDQILGDIKTQPTNWEMFVTTALAEMTLDRLIIAWEGQNLTIDATTNPPEKNATFGTPNQYVQRRLAVMFQRPNGKIRGYFFRIAQKTPQESSITHNKTGEQISIPIRFKILADPCVSDVYARFLTIRDQQ